MVIFFCRFWKILHIYAIEYFRFSLPDPKKYREKAADCRRCRIIYLGLRLPRDIFSSSSLYCDGIIWGHQFEEGYMLLKTYTFRCWVQVTGWVWGWNASEGSLLTCEKCGKVLWKPKLCLLNLCEDWVRSSFRLGQLAYAVHEDWCHLRKENQRNSCMLNRCAAKFYSVNVVIVQWLPKLI